jgi:hypothetical protein
MPGNNRNIEGKVCIVGILCTFNVLMCSIFLVITCFQELYQLWTIRVINCTANTKPGLNKIIFS